MLQGKNERAIMQQQSKFASLNQTKNIQLHARQCMACRRVTEIYITHILSSMYIGILLQIFSAYARIRQSVSAT